jgi:hypothetical protein
VLENIPELGCCGVPPWHMTKISGVNQLGYSLNFSSIFTDFFHFSQMAKKPAKK